MFNGIDATSCSAYDNNVMTPLIGSFYNAYSLFYFSNCSIAAFKTTLLTSDMKLANYKFYSYF